MTSIFRSGEGQPLSKATKFPESQNNSAVQYDIFQIWTIRKIDEIFWFYDI